MPKLNGKYDIKEMERVNCAIVEGGISSERVDFLKKVLEHNGYTVMVAEDPAPKTETEATNSVTTTYTIGVTDQTFNLSLVLFGRHLKTLNNKVLLPEYWESGKESDEWYFTKLQDS